MYLKRTMFQVYEYNVLAVLYLVCATCNVISPRATCFAIIIIIIIIIISKVVGVVGVAVVLLVLQ